MNLGDGQGMAAAALELMNEGLIFDHCHNGWLWEIKVGTFYASHLYFATEQEAITDFLTWYTGWHDIIEQAKLSA